LIRIEAGLNQPTYGYAISGLPKSQQHYINQAINDYQVAYFKAHGHYTSEAHVVKIVLAAQTAEEYWRANLPFPVVPVQDRTPEQELMSQFMSLVEPKKRMKFLKDHPGFADQFGVYDNPAVYLHNRPLFEAWTRAVDKYRAGVRALTEETNATGKWTP